MAFFGGGTDDLFRNLVVEPFAPAAREGLFHAAIFTGMEGQNRDSSAGIQAGRQVSQERFERRELVVDRNA